MNVIHDYLEEMESDRKSQQTLKASKNSLMMFYRWKFNNPTLQIEELSSEQILGATSKDIRAYKIYMSKVYKPTGANTKLRYIKMFFDWLVKVELKDTDIFSNIEMFTEPKRRPVSMDTDEIGTLLKYMKKLKTIHGRRDYVILSTLLASGIRISELLSIKPNMITKLEFEDGNAYGLTIIGKGNKERETILTEGAYNALQQYIEKNKIEDDERLFKVQARTIEKNLKVYLEKCGMSTKYTPHKLRHTFATLLYENDVQIEEISKYLGHESTSTTTEYYVKISDKQKRKASMVHPMNNF